MSRSITQPLGIRWGFETLLGSFVSKVSAKDDEKIYSEEKEALKFLVAIDTTFNKQTLLKAFEHDWNFFKEIVDIFVSDYPAIMATIREALDAKDGDTLQQAAHSLKGMLYNFQADTGVRQASKLEEIGRRGEFDNVDQVYEMLSAELADLEKLLLDLIKEVQG